MRAASPFITLPLALCDDRHLDLVFIIAARPRFPRVHSASVVSRMLVLAWRSNLRGTMFTKGTRAATQHALKRRIVVVGGWEHHQPRELWSWCYSGHASTPEPCGVRCVPESAATLSLTAAAPASFVLDRRRPCHLHRRPCRPCRQLDRRPFRRVTSPMTASLERFQTQK